MENGRHVSIFDDVTNEMKKNFNTLTAQSWKWRRMMAGANGDRSAGEERGSCLTMETVDSIFRKPELPVEAPASRPLSAVPLVILALLAIIVVFEVRAHVQYPIVVDLKLHVLFGQARKIEFEDVGFRGLLPVHGPNGFLRPGPEHVAGREEWIRKKGLKCEG
ncbi:phosphate import ATP-binding protein pstB [Striga asiatica]|uniref:Phosphate import ATP-binding protein pstB n=1 Tax=Striga asiatica TaxID=4170 RepID=A0A5A7R5V9_STRAF|nr:phosphate import ATP-binding protein pstB [Striga asiatica]